MSTLTPESTFRNALNQHFPGAMPEADFVKQTLALLSTYGFCRSNTIPCIGVCRDELTRTLVDAIQQTWGEAFNGSSLGGMLFLGTTGFSAAEHHAPEIEGRERYVYFAMPHIALGEHGEQGLCTRPGRDAPSTACGALMAFQQELASGHLSLTLDPDDVEQSLLKQRLFKKIQYGQVPDLVTLTQLAHAAILEDLERMISLTVDPVRNDYAVLTGIQIHGPQGSNYVWPGALYALVDGQYRRLSLP